MHELIEKITIQEMEFISCLDYGNDAEKHLESLRDVIFNQNGVINNEQYWYPYEVIELGSNWLQEGHEAEFIICTLLVLLNVENGSDYSTDLEYKFETHACDYDKLPENLREIILNEYLNAGCQ